MDSSFYPVMLYKLGGPHEIHGGKFDTLIARDEAEKDAAQSAGWRLTTDEAREHAPVPSDDVPATRAELEAKADELGIKHDKRTSDAKLSAKIAAELRD